MVLLLACKCRKRLEFHSETDAKAILSCGRKILIIESMDVKHTEKFEDILQTYREFHVRTLSVHDVTALWKCHESVAIPVLRQVRIILIQIGRAHV